MRGALLRSENADKKADTNYVVSAFLSAFSLGLIHSLSCCLSLFSSALFKELSSLREKKPHA